ncbi:hypothetical protein [Hydrogenophaga sp. PML113]|uniref:hypothetical protein n=1 Tax=Hydrogenophaga sp. PML113 TaxID=1899350 RepID=UPI0011131F8F|nr:hypothetical protein [Hydrogenophaga sp. PML113]
MRDDLHHCLPQTHRWRRVVRVACAPGLGGDLSDELARSVWEPTRDLLASQWGVAFAAALSTEHQDLFGVGVEQIQAKLAALEDCCTSPLARRMSEIAMAEVTINGPGPGTLDTVVRATLEIAAQDGIEGAVAWVADQRGEKHARPLRVVLTQALAQCNLGAPPPPKKRRPKLSVSDGLEMPLALKGV